jgi:uncharacterized protein involved in propanediol utilization
VTPRWKTFALRAVQLAAEQWNSPLCAAIEIRSSIPVARGFGSSTADCVAAVRALANLLGYNCTSAETARLVQQAEHASDATMFDLTPLVFLPERGESYRYLSREWPSLHVTAFDLGGEPVDTLRCTRPAYTEEELDEFEALLVRLERAFHSADAAALGECSTRSAVIQQRYRPHRRWTELQQLRASLGAYGVAISHSGTAAALLSAHPLPVPSAISWLYP